MNTRQGKRGRSFYVARILPLALLALLGINLRNAGQFTKGNKLLSSQQFQTLFDSVQQPHGSKQSDQPRGYVRPDYIFGHVHLQKTAGTNLNGMLAAKYERVCGHKGYSYDSYQFNERVKQAQRHGNATTHLHNVVPPNGTGDLISKYKVGMNRGRVPKDIMEEIGFEDCDYISHEVDWKFWKNDLSIANHRPKMELHVPCRDPIEHFFSLCNSKRHKLDCIRFSLMEDVRACTDQHMNRFNKKLDQVENITLRCFENDAVDMYVDYMGQFLQPKRYPAHNVYRTSSKTERNKTQEQCLKQNIEWTSALRKILLEKYEYFRWCDECMSSDRNLLKDIYAR